MTLKAANSESRSSSLLVLPLEEWSGSSEDNNLFFFIDNKLSEIKSLKVKQVLATKSQSNVTPYMSEIGQLKVNFLLLDPKALHL